jgi:hypothetical protein
MICTLILLALSVMDFPGKHALVVHIARRPRFWRGLNYFTDCDAIHTIPAIQSTRCAQNTRARSAESARHAGARVAACALNRPSAKRLR